MPFVLLLLVGLTHLVEGLANAASVDPVEVFHRFLPPHTSLPDNDPFALVESLLGGIASNRGQLSLYAAPAFVWFSTRLFAGVRTALNDVFDVSVRPPRPRNFFITLLLAKLRDIGMVVATVVLFLANTLLTTALTLVQARGAQYVPRELQFFVSNAGRLLGDVVALAFSVSLFFVVYKYASIRKLSWRSALLASTFTAVLFEIAKRLYGLYLANFASLEAAGGDANIGAAILFILWIYYTSIVFLLGGVVAETWELRRMQKRQRAILR